MESEGKVIGGGVFYEKPWEVVPVDYPGGEALICRTPKIEEWQKVYGTNKQVIELGKHKIELSYEAGAAKGKEGSGDAVTLFLAATQSALIGVLETDDYLSPPRKKGLNGNKGELIDDGWQQLTEDIKNQTNILSECWSIKDQINWVNCDIAGADLQRLFPKSTELRDFTRLINSNEVEGGIKDSNLAGIFDLHYYPVL